MSFAPHYFNYMSGRLRAATAAAAGGGPGRPAGAPGGTPGTCLAKVLGVFTVACKPQPGPGGGGAGGEGAGGGAGLAAKDLKDKVRAGGGYREAWQGVDWVIRCIWCIVSIDLRDLKDKAAEQRSAEYRFGGSFGA